MQPPIGILDLPPPTGGIRLSYGQSTSQFGCLRLPAAAGAHPLVHVIHGGFWRCRYDFSHMEHICVALAEIGFATWNIEYRRIGETGGGWPGTGEDVLAAIAFATTLAEHSPLNLERVAALGFSAGGHLALWAAAAGARIDAVISLAGITDLEMAASLNLSGGAVHELLGGRSAGTHEACPRRCSIRVPQRLIHGVDDEEVPIALSRSYTKFKRQCNEDVELTELPAAGHFDPIDPRTESCRHVLAAVRRACCILRVQQALRTPSQKD